MKRFTIFLLFTFFCSIIVGCTTDHKRTEEILIIYSEAPVKALDGIIDDGLEGIQNTTVTLTWNYLSTGETVDIIEIKEIYTNEDYASYAWKIRRENMNVISQELKGNSFTYRNTTHLKKTYEDIKKMLEDNDTWEILQNN